MINMADAGWQLYARSADVQYRYFTSLASIGVFTWFLGNKLQSPMIEAGFVINHFNLPLLLLAKEWAMLYFI